MKEILIVPDVHGRTFWEPALDFEGEVIFLGDYTDPYPKENISMADACNEMLRIVDFKRRNPERVTLLIGNHELHYYDMDYRCSRFSFKYYDKIHELLTGEETAGMFQISRLVGQYLFVHAGVLNGWYEAHREELNAHPGKIDEQLNALFNSNQESYFEISLFRGGFHSYGSPIWADKYEFLNERTVFNEELIQIVGHSQLQSEEPLKHRQIWITDNRRLYRLSELESWN
ncbi:MAG: metallophosphoesterase [Tannerellaceae bacterium]|jgi:hypothetical protein|nr:metallophosphoesterase [Tannerellaceae bacterium]